MWGPRWGLVIEGRPKPRNLEESPKASWRIVSDDFFSTMGIPVLRSRGFVPSDTADSTKVVLLSATTVQRFWAGRNPIGARIALPFDPAWRTVICITA